MSGDKSAIRICGLGGEAGVEIVSGKGVTVVYALSASQLYEYPTLMYGKRTLGQINIVVSRHIVALCIKNVNFSCDGVRATSRIGTASGNVSGN